MSDEEAFQAALDANPDDHVTRLVFADWLEERGDPRAEGYRAMGKLRLSPYFSESTKQWCFFNARYYKRTVGSHHLSHDWIHAAMHFDTNYIARKSRSQLENEVAEGFADLDTERRTELLAGVPA